MKVDLLSSAEARKQSISSVSDEIEQELTQIKKAITKAINLGQTECWYDGYLCEHTQTILEELGYEVNCIQTPTNDIKCLISW